ncbi:MAG: DUF3645 domain-containing protein [Gammaproteobacteria bacterium]
MYAIRQEKTPVTALEKLANDLVQRLENLTDYMLIPHGLVNRKENPATECVCMGIVKKTNSGIDWLQVNPNSDYHSRILSKKCITLTLKDIEQKAINTEWLTSLLSLKAVYPHNKHSGYYKDMTLYQCLLSQLKASHLNSGFVEGDFAYSDNRSPFSIWQTVQVTLQLLVNFHFEIKSSEVFKILLLDFQYFCGEKAFTFYKQVNQSEEKDTQLQLEALFNHMYKVLSQSALNINKENAIDIISHFIAKVEKKSKIIIKSRKKEIIKSTQISKIEIINDQSFPYPNIDILNKQNHSNLTSENSSQSIEATIIFPKLDKKLSLIKRAKIFDEQFCSRLPLTKCSHFNDHSLQKIIWFSAALEKFFFEHVVNENENILQDHQWIPDEPQTLVQYIKKFASYYHACQAFLLQCKEPSGEFSSSYDPKYFSKNVIVQFLTYALLIIINQKDPQMSPFITDYGFSAKLMDDVDFSQLARYFIFDNACWAKLCHNLVNFFAGFSLKKEQLFYTSFSITFDNSKEPQYNYLKVCCSWLQKNNPDALKELEPQSKYSRYYDRKITKEERHNRLWLNLWQDSPGYLPSLWKDLRDCAFIAKASLSPLYETSYYWQMRSFCWSNETVSRYYWKSRLEFEINENSVPKKNDSTPYLGYQINNARCQRYSSNEKDNRSNEQRIVFMPSNRITTPVLHGGENEFIATQHQCPTAKNVYSYLEISAIQSQSLLKIERLYIAFKNKQLDLGMESDIALVKQTLFEDYGLLMDTIKNNQQLVEKIIKELISFALGKEFSLTQHESIGGVLQIVIMTLGFYFPLVQSNMESANILGSLNDLFKMLVRKVKTEENQFSDNTRLYLCTYAILSIQYQSELNDTMLSHILWLLIKINYFNVENFKVDKVYLIAFQESIFRLQHKIFDGLQEKPDILKKVIVDCLENISLPNAASWVTSGNNFALFTLNDYAVEPFSGKVYFKNSSIIGLPQNILNHELYKAYRGDKNVSVFPTEVTYENNKYPGYCSIDNKPTFSVALVGKALIYIEWIEEKAHYLLDKKVIGENSLYPLFLQQSYRRKHMFWHWRVDDDVVVKTEKGKVLFRWNNETKKLFFQEELGYILPWQHINAEKKSPSYRTFVNLTKLDNLSWIMLINNIDHHHDDDTEKPVELSIRYLRLGLDVLFNNGQFFCQQLHGYTLCHDQKIDVLTGFEQYWIFQPDDKLKDLLQKKVLIPYYKLNAKGNFFHKEIIGNFYNTSEGEQKRYFVYEWDQRLNLLKANTVSEKLYLGLIYLYIGSLSHHNMTGCHSYHLSGELLKECEQNHPYTMDELHILEQWLSISGENYLHPEYVSLYLQAYYFLNFNKKHHFLFEDDGVSYINLEEAKNIISKRKNIAQELFSIYCQYKDELPPTLKLNKVIIRFFEEEEKSYQSMREELPIKNINHFYYDIFSKREMHRTEFENTFSEFLSEKFRWQVSSQVAPYHYSKFSEATFEKMLSERFRIENILSLYGEAMEICSEREKNYFFTKVLYFSLQSKSVLQESLPYELLVALTQMLILVAENPRNFDSLPSWCNESHSREKFVLTDISFSKTTVISKFPQYSYDGSLTYLENGRMRDKSDRENEAIWENFKCYDLDNDNKPKNINSSAQARGLIGERHMPRLTSDYRNKVHILSQYHDSIARNNRLYNFLLNVMHQCDNIKKNEYSSVVNFSLLPKSSSYWPNSTIIDESNELTTSMYLNVPEKITFFPLEKYFNGKKISQDDKAFPFESKIKNHSLDYEFVFFNELKNSWVKYIKQEKNTYRIKNATALIDLKNVLMKQKSLFQRQSFSCWKKITELMKHTLFDLDGQKNFLKKYSGDLTSYQKIDLLQLLINPTAIATYQPSVWGIRHLIYQEIANYIYYEIMFTTNERQLSFVEDYEKYKNTKSEKVILEKLISVLQEVIDVKAFDSPASLLFQLKHYLIIRPVQWELLQAFREKNSHRMYQLNMGEGKSSVILPLLCYELPNESTLFRVMVPQALFSTMRDLLYFRLSGFKRKLYTLPFHRYTDTSIDSIRTVFELLTDCKNNKGILLLTPEHQMCFELKYREIVLEYQQQREAKDYFDWDNYREKTIDNSYIYNDLVNDEYFKILKLQDKKLKEWLVMKGYLNKDDKIIKFPTNREKEDFRAIEKDIDDSSFREWSCIEAAYKELIYNSKEACVENKEKLELFKKISEIPIVQVLDESDEILRHGTELNYTLGNKYHFAGGESRWLILESLLNVYFYDPSIASILKKGSEQGFVEIKEGHSRHGGVNFIRMFDQSYFDEKIKPILVKEFFNIESIFKGLGACKLTPDDVLTDKKITLRNYIEGIHLSEEQEKYILNRFSKETTFKEQLLIGRGWLGFNLFYHILSYAYCVNYGLHENKGAEDKKIIAVPFIGKDTPTLRSEFSHPDVMIGFTILSYLYKGLSLLEKRYALNIANQYLLSWFEKINNYPNYLANFKCLDLSDDNCINKLHSYLAKSSEAIIFYINNFVFPKNSYQYPEKISSDAHHIVGYSHLSLGFSGTDDKKITLPYEIQSLRTSSQQSTNAQLVSVLLEPRNRQYYSIKAETSTSLLDDFCRYINSNKNCSILLDAGALITGMSNLNVAYYLLEKLNQFQGIIYFTDDTQQLTVLSKYGNKPLHQWHGEKKYLFAYLDDIHTRGTDLKLPLECHGLLTVGINMEKDKLTQAAMRLRQLASFQSISFWGANQLTKAISKEFNIDKEKIDSYFVLSWVSRNTVCQINSNLLAVTERMINFQFLRFADAIIKKVEITMPHLSKYLKTSLPYSLEDFYGFLPKEIDLVDYLYNLCDTKLRIFWEKLSLDIAPLKREDNDLFINIMNVSEKKALRKKLHAICKKMSDYLSTGKVQLSLDNDEEKQVEVEIIQEKKTMVVIPKKKPKQQLEWDYCQLTGNDQFIAWGLRRGIFSPLKEIAKYIKTISLSSIRWEVNTYMTNNYIASIEDVSNLQNYVRPVDTVLLYRCNGNTAFILLSGKEAEDIRKTVAVNENYILLHLGDVNGVTQFPLNSKVTKKEERSLTAIRIFAGQCYYDDLKTLNNRLGRIKVSCFEKIFDNKKARDCYDQLIKLDYLAYNGIMELKLVNLLNESKETATKNIFHELKNFSEKEASLIIDVLKKINNNLIFDGKTPLKENYHNIFNWILIRGRGDEYLGSNLEKALDVKFKGSLI